MTAAALIFCIAVLYLVLLHVSEKKGGRWETVTAVLGFVLFTPLVLAYGSFVSLLTVGLPLKCILPESVWDVIRVRFGDGKIDVWTLPSMIPWGIIGWLEIAVARRLWRGWQRRRDKA